MRTRTPALAVAALMALSACGSAQEPTMPDVTGEKLDVALSDIKRAGFTDDVEVVGGGLFGVIDESNWTVCKQLPAAGRAITKPRLEVDRHCSTASPQPSTSRTTHAPSPSPTDTAGTNSPSPSASSTPTPTPSVTTSIRKSTPSPTSDGILTTSNNSDFARIAKITDQCSPALTAFSKKYEGRTIKFDGSVGAIAPHGSARTRFDVMVNLGDDGQGTAGPNFQFRDVNLVNDLHLTGNVPDSMAVGDNLRVTATIVGQEKDSCLFLLTPVTTQYR